MAVTEQEFIDSYKGLSADKQQKMYNAGNAQVKQWIDNYNNTQVKPQNIQSNNGNNNMNTNTNNSMVSNNNVNDKIVSNSSNLNNQSNLSNQSNLGNQNRQTFNYTDEDYYTLGSQARQNDIVNNLNNYRQTNPEYFTDYENFKKNFSYNDRSDVQKQTLDTWYKGYQKGMELNSKAVSDLATQYKNGLISDSDLEQLRTTNQGKYGEVMQYINKQTILSKYDEENTPSASANPFQGIIDQYYNNLLTASQTNASSEMFDNYKSQMNSPEMTEMSDQLADLDGQLKEYQNELNRIKSDVERRYEGTGASKTKINAIIADESYKIQEAMNTASLQYNTLATKYNNRMTQYQNEFQLQLQEYQFNMQQRNQQMQELGFVMDLMNFETNEQKDEREWNNYVRQYDFQYGNINSKDEASRRRAIENAVDSVLTEFSGITMMRSREQMVEDIKNLVDGGMSLGEAITKNIREPIMQKPEYQTWKAQKLGTSTVSIGGTNYTYDSNGYLQPATNYNIPDYTAVSEETMNTALKQVNYLGDGSYGGQCGSFVNNYLQDMGIGRLYTDPIEAKKSVVNSDTPTVGSVAVFDWSNSPNATEAQKKYGHVAIVTAVNYQNGTITVKESNHGGDEKVHTSTYRMDQVYGYFNPTVSKEQSIQNIQEQQAQQVQQAKLSDPYLGASGYTSNGTEINSGGWITSLEDQYGKSWASNDERNSTLQAYGIDLKQYNEQKQNYAKYFESVKLVENAQKMYDDIQELLDWNENYSSSGLGSRHKGRKDLNTYYMSNDPDNYAAWIGYDAQTANGVNMYNLIKNNQMLDRYLELKGSGAQFGVMTNSEWGIVGSTTNKLNWISSDAEFEKTLRELQNNYKSIIESNGGKVQSNTPQQNIDMSSMQNTGTIIQSNGVYTKTVNGKVMYSNDGVNWY